MQLVKWIIKAEWIKSNKISLSTTLSTAWIYCNSHAILIQMIFIELIKTPQKNLIVKKLFLIILAWWFMEKAGLTCRTIWLSNKFSEQISLGWRQMKKIEDFIRIWIYSTIRIIRRTKFYKFPIYHAINRKIKNNSRKILILILSFVTKNNILSMDCSGRKCTLSVLWTIFINKKTQPSKFLIQT